MDPFIVVCAAIKYSFSTQEEVDQKLHQLAIMGYAKEAYVYRRETVQLKHCKTKGL